MFRDIHPDTHICKYVTAINVNEGSMTLKESKEEYVGSFGREKGNREIM